MHKFVRLNTVLIPSKKVSEEAISLSKKLGEKYKTEFVLDGANFHPHITLARVSFVKDRVKFLGNIHGLKIQEMSFGIDRFILYKSILLKDGPIYKKIKEFKAS